MHRWYEYCRPYLEQLNPRDDLELVPYVGAMVARAKEFNADTLVMMADDGGYPLYPSKLAPINPHIHGQDLLGMIEQECRRQGLRFGLGFLGVHCNSYVAATQPDWAMRSKDGQTKPFYEWHLICLNSPYGTYYLDLICEALARYAVDYLYVEGEYFHPVRPESDGGCYCASCRVKFRAAYGKELADAPHAERLRFYNDGLTAFQAAVQSAAREISPETVVIGTIYHDMMGSGDVVGFSRHTDMIAKENMEFGACGSPSLHMTGLGMLRLKTRARKPALGTWWPSVNVDHNFHQRSAVHSRLTFMQCLAYGAAIQPHVQSLLEFERWSMPIMAELFSCVQRVRPYMVDAGLLPYIAVLEQEPQHTSNEARSIAFCNALLERHLPFDLITPDQVRPGQLSAYRAVIVGDGGALSEQSVADLADYVRGGGGLMCLGQVGKGLAELAGVRLEGQWASGRPEHPLYYRFETALPLWSDLRGRLLSVFRPLAKVVPSADCRVEAQIIGLDYGRMHKDHMGVKPYPASPLGPMLVTRNVGAGRVVYLAGDLASMAMPWKVADAEVLVVLANAALWAAGGQPPLTTNAPPSVEFVTYVKPDRLAVFVMNETVNQTESGGVIRYVVSLSDIEIRLQADSPVRSVATVTGQPVSHEVHGRWLTVRLPKLNEYEVLLIDLAESPSPGSRASSPPK